MKSKILITITVLSLCAPLIYIIMCLPIWNGKEIAISMLITLGLIALFIGLTYLFVNLRRIDNTRKVEIADVSDN